MLVLKQNIAFAHNGKSFGNYDKTGTYTSNNTGGYGSLNPMPSDATGSTISIWNPLSNNLPDTTQPAQSIINSYPTLPNYVDNPFTVTNVAAGLGMGTFIDGVYRIAYTITGTFSATPFTYTVGCYVLATYNIRCCLDRWQQKESDGCGCGGSIQSEGYKRYMKAELKWDAMLNAMCCQQINKAASFLTQLQNMCPNDCGCGN